MMHFAVGFALGSLATLGSLAGYVWYLLGGSLD